MIKNKEKRANSPTGLYSSQHQPFSVSFDCLNSCQIHSNQTKLSINTFDCSRMLVFSMLLSAIGLSQFSRQFVRKCLFYKQTLFIWVKFLMQKQRKTSLIRFQRCLHLRPDASSERRVLPSSLCGRNVIKLAGIKLFFLAPFLNVTSKASFRCVSVP